MANQQHPPEVRSVSEGPELGQTSRPQVPTKTLKTSYPLIDCDPHFTRVVSYARTSDWIAAGLCGSVTPGLMTFWQHTSPTGISRQSLASIMRLSVGVGMCAGFLLMYERSAARFYGFTENRREIEMDMREMTDRVKKGLPIYGESTLTEYMQGAASRQSRYSGIFLHVMPWFNFVNHNQHGVDTAKYYQNAERELEAERTKRGE